LGFPIGDWVLLCLGLLAWAEKPPFQLDKSLRIIPPVWVLGWLFEQGRAFSPPWDWHYPRIFLLMVLAIIAWGKTKERRISCILLATMCLLVQELFLLNEPGIFAYDKWLFAGIFVTVALISSPNLWNMVLALAAGQLMSMGLTVFLFEGVLRYYSMPNPFLWHFSWVSLLLVLALKQVLIYFKSKRRTFKRFEKG